MAEETKKKQKRTRRNGKLVIVESPAKARTVERFLGKDYRVRASVGHVRDLLRSRLSVDIENDFDPTYRVPNEKRPVVKELTADAAKATEIYLATDPDREGEAIAWHLIAAAKIDPERVRRVVFHEITEPAIKEAFSHPRPIDMNLVDAQQARRILDRLVGYQITPLLWDRVRSRLSAGRVQSVAVRLIVEREREIDAFDPEEYWTIDAELCQRDDNNGDCEPVPFVARLVKIDGEKAELHNEDEVKPHVEILEKAEYIVSEVKRGTRRRKPAAPFTTSTMQQDAARRLGFTTRKTMSLAQQLYEGIELEDGVVGLITYMRTDSVNVSKEAQNAARAYVKDTYGDKYLPDEPRVYKTRAKGAQEAHEAIRPTSVERTPKAMKPSLSRDQYRLYNLIWQRFVASQMSDAVYDTLRIEIEAGSPGEDRRPYLFRASGSILKFKGFLAIYEEARDEDDAPDEDEGRILPDIEEGRWMQLLRLLPEQHWTQPPPRYTEASLVKTLEEYGIGRPSTYAPIISTVQQRGYVTREDKRLVPTETGEVVNDLLVEFFPDVLDVAFTASMEEKLDEIAEGNREWVPMMHEFYEPFAQQLEYADKHMPETRKEETVDRDCPKCGSPLIIRWGRYGKFIGCSNYPECRHTEPWLEKIGVQCPQCDTGEIVERRTRKGRVFYGCSNYPDCEFTTWKRPLPQPCPNCGGLLEEKRKDTAACTQCDFQGRIDRLPEVKPVTEEQG
jgi:DNA topoisomerase-1